MRVGINALYLIPHRVGGTEVYARSLLRALAQIDPLNQYYIFVNKETGLLDLGLPSNFHYVPCRLHANQQWVRYVWEQLVLPWQARNLGLDILHSLAYVAPFWIPCASVVTIHDTNYRDLREAIAPIRRSALSFFVPASARRSVHVLTDSHFSKTQIETAIGIPSDKITVIYLGAGRLDYTNSTEACSQVLRRYKTVAPYIVAFSSPSIHKNILRLVQAFTQGCLDLPHRLVLLGRVPPNLDLAGKATLPNADNRIIATGYVPDSDVLPLVANAELLVVPSWYEGFGLPILEAQQLGVPVASSSACSLPEIAGKGAVFFDPHSVEEMAESINHCLTDAELKSTLISKGRDNAKRFSWEKTARETLNVYEKTYDTLKKER